jgi:hypothetical protein
VISYIDGPLSAIEECYRNETTVASAGLLALSVVVRANRYIVVAQSPGIWLMRPAQAFVTAIVNKAHIFVSEIRA